MTERNGLMAPAGGLPINTRQPQIGRASSLDPGRHDTKRDVGRIFCYSWEGSVLQDHQRIMSASNRTGQDESVFLRSVNTIFFLLQDHLAQGEGEKVVHPPMAENTPTSPG